MNCKNDIQNVFNLIGGNGCYFLSLCTLGEVYTNKKVDIIDVYYYSVENNLMTKDCYIYDGAKIMEYITGKKWECIYSENSKEGYYNIICYGYKTNTHFELENHKTLENSIIRKYGKIISYRCYKVVK